MKLQKRFFILTVLAVALFLPSADAQTNVPAATDATTTNNPAATPASRTGGALKRQTLVLKRAHDNPGDYDIEFIGDSITQFWETFGSNVWTQYYSHRKCINMGVSGDQTQNVLWRFDQGQLDGIHAKAAVVMIGTNNTKTNQFSEAQILEADQDIIQQIRTRQPDTKILLFAIFPRGQTFSEQRGKILQVNEALAKLDDGSHIFYYDIGPQLIENDGSISPAIMPDYLHPRQKGYEIWASAMEPKLKEILGEN